MATSSPNHYQSTFGSDFCEDWYSEHPPVDSPFQHSRDSSCTSSIASPTTSTFSSFSHSRLPSNSSLATSPDLSVTHAKSELHDLVEDPSEREDSFDLSYETVFNEPICICDTPFCEHRDSSFLHSGFRSATFPEWTPGDDCFSDGEFSQLKPIKRRRSGEANTDSIASRLSRRWPSISQRWRDSKASPALSNHSVRSTSSSRPSSLRLPSLRRSVATESRTSQDIPPMPEAHQREQMIRALHASQPSGMISPLGIEIPSESTQPVEDPIDREKLSSTPLLPPTLAELQSSYFASELNSPLQSPSVASVASSPELLTTNLPTPPLSAKPSMNSMTGSSSTPTNEPAFPILSSTTNINDDDPWAIKLGHANFHIEPTPYLPSNPTSQTCATLLSDWESARSQYLKQASRISEHYGPTSSTFMLTEQKWTAIEARWRANLEQAYAEATAAGESPELRRLAEVVPLASARLPSLGTDDPNKPSKFPGLVGAGADGIVGPMVQYARVAGSAAASTGVGAGAGALASVSATAAAAGGEKSAAPSLSPSSRSSRSGSGSGSEKSGRSAGSMMRIFSDPTGLWKFGGKK